MTLTEAIQQLKMAVPMKAVTMAEFNDFIEAVNMAIDALEKLPSAEPEIIRCRDCKHHDGIRCFRWNSTIITGFDDFCSNAERRTDE